MICKNCGQQTDESAHHSCQSCGKPLGGGIYAPPEGFVYDAEKDQYISAQGQDGVIYLTRFNAYTGTYEQQAMSAQGNAPQVATYSDYPQGTEYAGEYDDDDDYPPVTKEQAMGYLMRRFISTILVYIPYVLGYSMVFYNWNIFGFESIAAPMIVGMILMGAPGYTLLLKGPIKSIYNLFSVDAATEYCFLQSQGKRSSRFVLYIPIMMLLVWAAVVIALSAYLSPFVLIFRFVSIPVLASGFNKRYGTGLPTGRIALISIAILVGLVNGQVIVNNIRQDYAIAKTKASVVTEESATEIINKLSQNFEQQFEGDYFITVNNITEEIAGFRFQRSTLSKYEVICVRITPDSMSTTMDFAGTEVDQYYDYLFYVDKNDGGHLVSVKDKRATYMGTLAEFRPFYDEAIALSKSAKPDFELLKQSAKYMQGNTEDWSKKGVTEVYLSIKDAPEDSPVRNVGIGLNPTDYTLTACTRYEATPDYRTVSYFYEETGYIEKSYLNNYLETALNAR